NGTGIMMRKNDWSYTTNITVEGYKVGFNAAPSITNEGSKPNGQNYQLKVIGCKTGIQCDAIANSGIQFTRSIIKNCENGVVVNKGTAGALHFHTCEIDATQNAFVTDAESSTRIMILQNQIQKGNVNINGAILTFIDCDFYNPAPQIVLGRNARSIITGNRFKEKVNIENHSLLECIIDHTPVSLEKLPEFPVAMLENQKQKPDREYLYLATDPEFGANPDGNTDNTQAIQKALDKAAAEGGGIVYLPPGKYKVLGNLNIPSGVELKGALDNSSAPVGPGSILQVYSGKGNLNAQPFMTMKENSGLRGVVFDYPEQKTSDLPNPIVYPYCVQVQGKNVYIVNVGIRAAYQGFDLFTYKCDNHYIDYISGHSLKTGIKVGGGSENGKICNLQYNLIVYACGYQTKFGSFSNSIEAYKDMVYTYGYENFDFLVVENCKDEWLYNNFAFGAQRGLLFTGNNAENASNGISVGMAIDGARRAYCFDALNSKGFDFINNQIVSTGEPNTRYIETTANFTGRVTLHNSDYWGSALQGVQVENGTVNLIAASFVQPGKDRFANIIGGKLNITASHITLKDPLLNSDNESRFSAQSSVLDGKGITTSKCELWKNNLSNTPTLAIPQSSVLDRTGWIASGSKNSNSANNAIDGKEDTRWTSGSQKEPGDWFKVDMRNKQKFNLIILDTTGSPNDTPAKYELYVSDDDLDWREPIATGEGSSMMTIISIPTQNARYFKVVQTGNTKTNYWSIHEAYVINDDYENAVKSTSQKDSNIFYANGNICLKGFSGKSEINVFRINGEKVFSCQSESQQVQVPMEQGIYVVHVNNQNHSFCKKIIIQ
ncbi:MAG TPA: carbohydrate-binding protein, partial [Coprobacter fastidiosus]|nr:carbohydrate-binding protein [Coprobacter fastidiosus]